MGLRRLVASIVGVTFCEALVILLATRAFVLGSYLGVGCVEVIFVAQWFYSRGLSFEDDRSRSWLIGFPAYLVGSVAGALVGLYISKSIGG